MTVARSIITFLAFVVIPWPTYAADDLVGTQAGESWSKNELSLKFRWCPPTKEFRMGSLEGEKGRLDNEASVAVTLTKGFWLAETEVSQAQWKALMGTTPWMFQTLVKAGDQYPATWVSYTDATAFCEELTRRERTAGRLPAGWQYRLPTEAEWEYACRAGTKTAYYFGDDAAAFDRFGWYTKNTYDVDEKYSHPVGVKKPNAWGLHDMHGNVWEWCRDWYQEKTPGGVDPEETQPGDKKLRSARGGCWYTEAEYCRSAIRRGRNPDDGHSIWGFRPALTRQ